MIKTDKLAPGMWVEFYSPLIRGNMTRSNVGDIPTTIMCENDIYVRKEGFVTELWDEKRYAKRRAISLSKERCIAQILAVYPRFCVVDLVTYKESVQSVDIIRVLDEKSVEEMRKR